MKLHRHICWALALLPAAALAAPSNGRLEASLTGYQVAPGPGDTGATGTVRLRVAGGSGSLCWEVLLRGLARAGEAHLHRGEAGTFGPVLFALGTPGPQGRASGCAPIERRLAREMLRDPHRFHVDVHAAGFPNGAARGQLRGGYRPDRETRARSSTPR